MDKIIKNERFRNAIDCLYAQKLIESDVDAASKIGISKSGFSRLLNDRKSVSDETLRKMNDAFGGIFNMAYFRGESDFLLVEDAKQKAVSPSTDEPTANIIELYASLIQDIEKIRQQVKQELAEVQALKHEYIEARDDFRKAITLLHPALKYEIPNEQPRMAAEPETPQK
jgi:transcriptional regulator with XRE-family HTH domain